MHIHIPVLQISNGCTDKHNYNRSRVESTRYSSRTIIRIITIIILAWGMGIGVGLTVIISNKYTRSSIDRKRKEIMGGNRDMDRSKRLKMG